MTETDCDDLRRLEDVLNGNGTLYHIFEIFMNRAQAISSDFRSDKLLDRFMPSIVAEKLLNYDLLNKAGLTENIGAILLAAIGYDSNTFLRFNKTSVERRTSIPSSVLVELIKAIDSIEYLNLIDIIYNYRIGRLSEFDVLNLVKISDSDDNHFKRHKYSGRPYYLNSTNSRVWSRLCHYDYEITDDYRKFLEYNISDFYYEQYLNLDDVMTGEFWKWYDLKSRRIVNNPIKEFFDLVDVGATYRKICYKRRKYEDPDIPNGIDFNTEIKDISIEISRVENHTYKKRKDKRYNRHHLIFPPSGYSANRLSLSFMNKDLNIITLEISTHNKLNSVFNRLRKRGYEIPILNSKLIKLINDRRIAYHHGYSNLLGLMEAAAIVAVEEVNLSNQELDLLELFFEYLEYQRMIISPENVKPRKN